MLLIILVVIALVAAFRFLLARYTGDALFANAVPAAVVVAFVLGSVSAPVFFPFAAAAPQQAAGGDDGTPVAASQPVDDSDACHRAGTLAQSEVPGSLDRFVREDGFVVESGSAISRRDGFALLGWAAKPKLDGPATAVCLAVDGHLETRAVSQYGLARSDVAAAFARPALTPSGYAVHIPPGVLARGTHLLQIVAELGDKSLRPVHGSRTVEVR